MSIFQLGTAYYLGTGVDRATTKGIELIKDAALKGQSAAALFHVDVYSTGDNEHPVDLKQAADWYELGTKNGEPRAEYEFAKALLNGAGVEKNQARAIELFE